MISVTAKVFPKQVLGPSINVNKWWYPWISLDEAVRPASLSNHRSGSHSEADSPQIASERLTAATGIVTIVPEPIIMLSNFLPERVVTGVENGTTSSIAHYDGRSCTIINLQH